MSALMGFVYGFIAILLILIVGLVCFGIVYRFLAPDCPSDNNIFGKTVLITGASSGIGLATAKELALRGGRIIVACRNLEKALKIAENIKTETGNSQVIVMELNLSDLRSVEKFVEEFIIKEPKLDILINNAGCTSKDKKLSAQGFELCYATNHLGHFLLTNLLIEKMKFTAGGRIINVTSNTHQFCKVNFKDLHFENRRYSELAAYAQSKLCNIYFTTELSKRLINSGISVNCLHPGAVVTEISNKNNTIGEILLTMVFKLLGKNSTKGAQTSIYLAVSDDISNITGEYFMDCKIHKTGREAQKTENGKQLWEISEKQCGFRGSILYKHYI